MIRTTYKLNQIENNPNWRREEMRMCAHLMSNKSDETVVIQFNFTAYIFYIWKTQFSTKLFRKLSDLKNKVNVRDGLCGLLSSSPFNVWNFLCHTLHVMLHKQKCECICDAFSIQMVAFKKIGLGQNVMRYFSMQLINYTWLYNSDGEMMKYSHLLSINDK